MWLGRSGEIRSAMDWRRLSRQDGRGEARLGMKRFGTAGTDRLSRRGADRRGNARLFY